MKITEQLAKHLRQVYFGGNWTSSNLKEALDDIRWEQASRIIGETNSILKLVYHLNYYVYEVSRVLEGNALQSSDKESFEHPKIESKEEWEAFLEKIWKDGERFAGLIEQLPDSILAENFTEAKYGSYYRNLQGIIEHIHYHLGQIVLLKKLGKSWVP